jgi:hypothetical protein
LQVLDIWRYRVLGLEAGDTAGNPANAFYDVVLPGPVVGFHGGGLNMDWYQPLHENGNILSYPQPSKNTFNPPDLGTYGVPCPPKSEPPILAICKANNGLLPQSGALIPATAEFVDNTSGTIELDYTNTTGSGDTFSYSKKLSDSQDIKQSYSMKSVLLGETKFSVSASLSRSNSWGNTQTSDSTTTSSTAIKILRSAISPVRAYEFFPVVYATLDGSIKVAHAADPLGSASGRLFWASLYGEKADPALNLPLRFVPTGNSQWAPNTLISRKQLRGFFLMTAGFDPANEAYDILALAPVDGDKVRVSAQVYNYSTGQSFKDCLVRFYAIKYDSLTNTEIGSRRLIGSTVISLLPRGTAPAQIIWNTSGFGPAKGAQAYRVYVELNSDHKIDEIYPPEDPSKQYAPGLPKGLDPGQNDEGWGLATVVAKSDAGSGSSFPAPRVSFGATPLEISNSFTNLFSTQNVAEAAGVPVELRAEVCTSGNSRDPVDVIVFDGDPAGGNVIAWKRIYVPSPASCEGTWFGWTPTRGQHHLVATIPSKNEPLSLANNRLLSATPHLQKAFLDVNVP